MTEFVKPLVRIVLRNQHKCFKFKRQYSVYLPDNNGTNNLLQRSYSSQDVDQLGSWNTRINFALSEEQSVRRGTPIPILRSSQVGIYSDRGRRLYQVGVLLNFILNYQDYCQ